MRARKRKGWHRYVNFVTVGVTGVLLAILLPIYWMISSSFKGPAGIFSANFLPTATTLDNYNQALNGTANPFGRYIINSVIVAVITTALVLFLATLAGYALGRLPMRGKLPILMGLLMISVFPAIAVIAPLFLLMRTIHWLNSYQALIVPYTAFNLPFAIWIMRNYMLGIPKEMEETARIDGCGPMRTVWSIIVPQVKPGLFTAGIFCFSACWTEFLMAISFNTETNFRTIPVGIANFGAQYVTPFGIIFAGATMASVPIAILVLVFRKSVVSGLTAGAVKG
jgi:multiple sugar transport system permease protein